MGDTPDLDGIAAQLLDDLQTAMAARDEKRLRQIFDDDVTIFGTGSANLDSEQSWTYLRRVLAQDETIRWEWRHVLPVAADGSVLCLAAVGTVGWDSSTEEQRDAFRLTCVAVRHESRWRLRHFHGSVPQVG